MVADGEEDAISPDDGQKLLNEESQEGGADRGQVEVVDHEESVELERREVLHDGATPEDGDVVGDEHGGGLTEAGHGGHALHEAEFAGGIADDGLEGLVEDGP